MHGFKYARCSILAMTCLPACSPTATKVLKMCILVQQDGSLLLTASDLVQVGVFGPGACRSCGSSRTRQST